MTNLPDRMRTRVTLASAYKLLDEGAAEIERLRALLRDIRDRGINAPIEDRIDAALGDHHE